MVQKKRAALPDANYRGTEVGHLEKPTPPTHTREGNFSTLLSYSLSLSLFPTPFPPLPKNEFKPVASEKEGIGPNELVGGQCLGGGRPAYQDSAARPGRVEAGAGLGMKLTLLRDLSQASNKTKRETETETDEEEE